MNCCCRHWAPRCEKKKKVTTSLLLLLRWLVLSWNRNSPNFSAMESPLHQHLCYTEAGFTHSSMLQDLQVPQPCWSDVQQVSPDTHTPRVLLCYRHQGASPAAAGPVEVYRTARSLCDVSEHLPDDVLSSVASFNHTEWDKAHFVYLGHSKKPKGGLYTYMQVRF